MANDALTVVLDILLLVTAIGMIVSAALSIIMVKSAMWRIPFSLLGIGGSILAFSHIRHFFPGFTMLTFVISALVIVTIAVLIEGFYLSLIYGKSALTSVILPRASVRRIKEKLQKMYGIAGSKYLLYAVAKELGFKWVSEGRKQFNYSPEKTIEVTPRIMQFFAWAPKVKVVEYKPEETLVVRMWNNFENFGGKKGESQSCDYLRGFLAGLGKSLHPDMNSEASETKCEMRGDEYCEFRTIFSRNEPKEELKEAVDEGR